MKTKERKAAIKLIDSAFSRLARCCEIKVEWDRYLDMNETEEREHRKFKPAGMACGLTKAQSVRLFAVKQVFERFVPSHQSESVWTPKAADFFHVKKSVFAACAIAEMCEERILAEFSHPEMEQWVASVDYAQLNKAN